MINLAVPLIFGITIFVIWEFVVRGLEVPTVLLPPPSMIWERIINWEALADAGTISEQDLDLFRFVETAQEAVDIIEKWEPAPARDNLPGRER